MSHKHPHRGSGFSLVEMLVVVAIIAMLAAIAVPSLLGAREKATHTACLDAFHVLDGEFANHLESMAAEGREFPADAAIDLTLERLETMDHVRNPRDAADLAYEKVEGPAFVPPPDSSCKVYVFDATPREEGASPIIVLTHFERGVNSFRIALD